jgi:RNA polymerase sigma factor (sigma-70 family)
LRGIAGRLVLGRQRKLASSLLRVLDVKDLEFLEASYARVASRPGDTWEEKIEVLRRCLGHLPEPQREVIQLYYWDELDCQGIAVRLVRPLETVKKRLQRARALLAECLQGRLAAPQGFVS